MTCPICYEDMDMRDYNDAGEGTETCHKLECGHAFHTKCIILVLTKTRHACPSCNKDKSPEKKLEIEGLMRTTLLAVKRDPRVKSAREEYETGKNEYKQALRQLQKEAREWITKRAEELKIKEYRSYYHSSASAVMATAREVAREMGPRYSAAVNSDRTPNNRWGPSVSKKTIFGANPPGYRDWKLRHPRIWFRL